MQREQWRAPREEEEERGGGKERGWPGDGVGDVVIQGGGVVVAMVLFQMAERETRERDVIVLLFSYIFLLSLLLCFSFFLFYLRSSIPYFFLSILFCFSPLYHLYFFFFSLREFLFMAFLSRSYVVFSFEIFGIHKSFKKFAKLWYFWL
jgi:hypothetical protein